MPEAGRDLDTVRGEVRQLLEQSQSFKAMPPTEQRALAHHMVRVGTYLADPSWLDAPTAPEVSALAEPGADEKDPVTSLKERLADKPGMVGKEFDAGAVRQGVQQFGELVKKVDFPAFVAGLVNGVFKAVVDASIEQMRAYGELLAATAKTVDQFAQDNISDGMARDHIRSRFPSACEIDTSGDVARLRPGAAIDSVDLGKAFNVKGTVDLDDQDSELALVNAAKLDMARSRQQLLATMVLLGINRIVVTDGRINAKVVFDMRADDSARRKASAEMHDQSQQSSAAGGGAAVIMPWGGGGGYAHSEQSHVATVASAVDDTSQASADVKAQLSGDVQLRFKSETFPLERMVDSNGLAMLNDRAQPVATPAATALKPPTGATTK
jgi:hypothetical protein